MMSSGLRVPIPEIPIPALAVPYAAPTAAAGPQSTNQHSPASREPVPLYTQSTDSRRSSVIKDGIAISHTPSSLPRSTAEVRGSRLRTIHSRLKQLLRTQRRARMLGIMRSTS